jgi:hypothetical protein
MSPRDRCGRLRWLAVVVAVTALVAAGCDDTAGTAGPQACGPAVADNMSQRFVEGDPWSGYAAFRDDGLLPGKLRYVEQIDQAARACDLTTGRADFIVTTIGQYLRHKPDGVIVGVIDQSQGADALVLNSRLHPWLTSADWLPRLVAEYASHQQGSKKPVLAYTGSSPSEELLTELASSVETIRPGQFELVSVDQSATALGMLERNQAQAAVLWEPDTSAARAAGYTVAHSSKDVPDAIVDVIVARRPLVARDPRAVAEFVEAYYAFIEGRQSSRAVLQDFIARDGHLDARQAESVVAGITLYTTAQADEYLNKDLFPLDEPQIRQSIRAIASLQALTDPSVTVRDDMVDGRFVAEANRKKTQGR